jgi:iron complex outermembrane receptor protein
MSNKLRLFLDRNRFGEHMKTDTQRFRKTAVARALITVLCGTASMMAAQETLAQSSSTLQRVEVTGSNIPRSEVESPSPVQIITADDMKKSGYTTVAEVLRDITANGQGTLSQGFNQAFAGGASGIALRGLTVGATLVLIDGHRMAPYPLSDDGERQFVDISSIPFAIVDRIEILKDGASAVYGSDAIAGVVNVILKKSFEGTLVSADIGGTQHGGGATKNIAITHGAAISRSNTARQMKSSCLSGQVTGRASTGRP